MQLVVEVWMLEGESSGGGRGKLWQLRRAMSEWVGEGETTG